ncbi:MAG: galactokinase family protein [Microthrixaceae bacterium]
MILTARASGRVNLIGDHTDYMGGLVMPMAIDLATTLTARTDPTAPDPVRSRIRVVSDAEPDPVSLQLPVPEPRSVEPAWGRYVAAVAGQLRATEGFTGRLTSTIPAGGGSPPALRWRSAWHWRCSEWPVRTHPGGGSDRGPLRGSDLLDRRNRTELALLCQRAEHEAVGVPSGVMDQLCICTAREGHATLIDCADLSVTQTPLPSSAAVWVVHSGESRRLAASGYADRRRSAEAAEALIGPLRGADPGDVEGIADPLLRRRARHVASECSRVTRFAGAMARGDLESAGRTMTESHASLRDDYEVSTVALDDLVATLEGLEGVFGARMTGAGFGGCVVALTRADLDLADPSVPLPRARDGSVAAWRCVRARNRGLDRAR